MSDVKPFGELELVSVEISKLKPYPNNPKNHSDTQIRRIAQAIEETGYFKDPIDIDQHNVIINGHGRVKAAALLGMKRVPAKVFRGITEEAAKAMRVRDNQVAVSTYDEDLLREEVLSLGDLYSLDNLGFDDDEIDLDFGADPNLDEIVAPDPAPQEPKSPKQVEYKQAYQIVVDCDSEDHQEKLYMRMTKEGLKCKVLSM